MCAISVQRQIRWANVVQLLYKCFCTGHSPNVRLVLGQRRRRRAYIKTTQYRVFIEEIFNLAVNTKEL